MKIAGTGIDIVEVSRIREVLDRHGSRFLGRVFTSAEVEYSQAGGVVAQHLAGRFAVKEAVFKALGTGWSGRVRWRDVEVRTQPSGEPDVLLTGGAACRARAMGIVKMHISISHTSDHAIAHAIAEAESA